MKNGARGKPYRPKADHRPRDCVLAHRFAFARGRCRVEHIFNRGPKFPRVLKSVFRTNMDVRFRGKRNEFAGQHSWHRCDIGGNPGMRRNGYSDWNRAMVGGFEYARFPRYVYYVGYRVWGGGGG